MVPDKSPSSEMNDSSRSDRSSVVVRRVCIALLVCLLVVSTLFVLIKGGHVATPLAESKRRMARTVKKTLEIDPKTALLQPIELRSNRELTVQTRLEEGERLAVRVISDRELQRYISAWEGLLDGDFVHYDVFYTANLEQAERKGCLKEGKYWIALENDELGLFQDSISRVELKTATKSCRSSDRR